MFFISGLLDANPKLCHIKQHTLKLLLLLLFNELITVALSPKTARTLNKRKESKTSCAAVYNRIGAYMECLRE